MKTAKRGPLVGIRIVEIAGLGPTPFTAMTLADMGADVVRITRPNTPSLMPQNPDILNRGRSSCDLDLKNPDDLASAKALILKADGLIEGMRPGVMERLGLGPDEMIAANPCLIYGRMTGWGQDGPLANTAGHDINYISLTGMLHAMGDEYPVIPLNLLGDFGGGGMYLAFGMVCALLNAAKTGQGQVVDAAIVDGVAHMSSMIYSLRTSGGWRDQRASNILDGAAPFYTAYACACGGHVAVGAIEPQFWAKLLELLGVTNMPNQHDQSQWPEMKSRLTGIFASESRDYWTNLFDGSDACVTPVLSIDEASGNPHLAARDIFGDAGPKAAPHFSNTPGQATMEKPREKVTDVLERWTSSKV